MYSAVKVGGQKLYDLARKGQVVERKPRRITIYELELLAQESATDYLLRCRCSKGTYIRTLCHDIGRQLGCGGTLYALRRTMAAGFRLDQAVTLGGSPGTGYSAPAAYGQPLRRVPGPASDIRPAGETGPLRQSHPPAGHTGTASTAYTAGTGSSCACPGLRAER